MIGYHGVFVNGNLENVILAFKFLHTTWKVIRSGHIEAHVDGSIPVQRLLESPHGQRDAAAGEGLESRQDT